MYNVYVVHLHSCVLLYHSGHPDDTMIIMHKLCSSNVLRWLHCLSRLRLAGDLGRGRGEGSDEESYGGCIFIKAIKISLKKYISLERQRTKEPCRLLSLQEGRELEIDKGRKPTPGEKYSRQLKVNKMWLLDSTLPYVIQQNIKPGLARKVFHSTKIF